MKIKGKKDLAAERLRGREAIDAVMLPRINEVMGPKFALYQAKAIAAGNNVTLTSTDSADDILSRYHQLMISVAHVESRRQALQAKIDNATSAAEIDAIIASL